MRLASNVGANRTHTVMTEHAPLYPIICHLFLYSQSELKQLYGQQMKCDLIHLTYSVDYFFKQSVK